MEPRRSRHEQSGRLELAQIVTRWLDLIDQKRPAVGDHSDLKTFNRLSREAGITTGQAEAAIRSFTDYLKEKTPGALHGEVDNVMKGGNFGKATKEKVEQSARQFGETMEAGFEELKKRMNDFFNPTKPPPPTS